jgi:DNA-directed RNA polymerase specialized sigma24 family protein
VAESRSEAADFIDDFELFESLRRDTQEIDGITSEEQALLELRVRAGGSLAQLAAMLGIGAAAIDSKLRRAAERARAHRGNAGTSDQRRTKR